MALATGWRLRAADGPGPWPLRCGGCIYLIEAACGGMGCEAIDISLRMHRLLSARVYHSSIRSQQGVNLNHQSMSQRRSAAVAFERAPGGSRQEQMWNQVRDRDKWGQPIGERTVPPRATIGSVGAGGVATHLAAPTIVQAECAPGSSSVECRVSTMSQPECAKRVGTSSNGLSGCRRNSSASESGSWVLWATGQSWARNSGQPLKLLVAFVYRASAVTALRTGIGRRRRQLLTLRVPVPAVRQPHAASNVTG